MFEENAMLPGSPFKDIDREIPSDPLSPEEALAIANKLTEFEIRILRNGSHYDTSPVCLARTKLFLSGLS